MFGTERRKECTVETGKRVGEKRRRKNLSDGVTQTEGAGVTQTEVGGVTHTAFEVQGAPQMGLLLKPYFKTDGEHSARVVESEFSR